MNRLLFERDHALGLGKARDVAQRLADEMADSYDVQSHWDGDSLYFSASGVSGVLAVSDGKISLDAKLGFLMASFKPRIEARLAANFDRYFSAESSAGE
jgi:putative polyhydroxyalkanoate system protein